MSLTVYAGTVLLWQLAKECRHIGAVGFDSMLRAVDVLSLLNMLLGPSH